MVSLFLIIVWVISHQAALGASEYPDDPGPPITEGDITDVIGTREELAAIRANIKPAAITPSDVYQALLTLEQHVLQIAQREGIQINTRPLVTVSGANPRFPFYLAQSLYRRCNRLQFQVCGTSVWHEPEFGTNTTIKPHRVLELVHLAQRRIDHIRHTLQLADLESTTITARPHTPSDVCVKILAINRLIDRTLDTKTRPVDVHTQLMQSLLALPNADVYPPDQWLLPPLVSNLKPADVHAELARSITQIGQILSQRHIDFINMSVTDDITVFPTDVYDLAVLVRSGVDLLADQQLSSPVLPFISHKRTHKTPSEVHQFARYLSLRLAEFDLHSGTQP